MGIHRGRAGLCAAALAYGGLAGLTADAQELPVAPAFTAGQLTALPEADWITNGGNVFNQRYSPLTQINRDTIKRLKAQWRTHLDGSGPARSTRARVNRCSIRACCTWSPVPTMCSRWT